VVCLLCSPSQSGYECYITPTQTESKQTGGYGRVNLFKMGVQIIALGHPSTTRPFEASGGDFFSELFAFDPSLLGGSWGSKMALTG